MAEELTKILYVEDDEDIAEIASMTLENIGEFTIQHCNSGKAAIDAIEAFSPQLVLMDVMMPGMDGPQTFARFKTMDNVKETPVIFMTARAQLHEQAQYLEDGALGVIVKPFDPMQLCNEIRGMWNNRCAD